MSSMKFLIKIAIKKNIALRTPPHVHIWTTWKGLHCEVVNTDLWKVLQNKYDSLGKVANAENLNTKLKIADLMPCHETTLSKV